MYFPSGQTQPRITFSQAHCVRQANEAVENWGLCVCRGSL